MAEFDREFVIDYLEQIKEEIDKFREYGSGTVDRRFYMEERIIPTMILSNGHYSLVNMEVCGTPGDLNESPFRIKVLSPKERYDDMRTGLERLTTIEDRKNFIIVAVAADNIEELTDVKGYFTLSE